ncbi:MAG TPA: ArsC/Spx/MgsR family protein, partial [Marinagarivorans sp.]|nr:ArsC/Spx/MgsR family protein [Marinagarivorans sp.]
VAYEFIDLRQPPIAPEQEAIWYGALGSSLVNTRSTTYRQLSPQEQAQIVQGDSLAVLQRHPTLIKRPVLQTEQAFYCGFLAATYQSIFQHIN